MSEKRFTFEYDDGQWGVPLFYNDDKKLCFDEVVDLLNEQQDTINNQEQKIKILQQEINDTQAIMEMLTEKLKGWNYE